MQRLLESDIKVMRTNIETIRSKYQEYMGMQFPPNMWKMQLKYREIIDRYVKQDPRTEVPKKEAYDPNGDFAVYSYKNIYFAIGPIKHPEDEFDGIKVPIGTSMRFLYDLDDTYSRPTIGSCYPGDKRFINGRYVINYRFPLHMIPHKAYCMDNGWCYEETCIDKILIDISNKIDAFIIYKKYPLLRELELEWW